MVTIQGITLATDCTLQQFKRAATRAYFLAVIPTVRKNVWGNPSVQALVDRSGEKRSNVYRTLNRCGLSFKGSWKGEE